MDNIAVGEGSFIVMLSAELIEQIAQVHFNKVMFKQQVQIVDSKATEAGYAFTLAFVSNSKKRQKSIAETAKDIYAAEGKQLYTNNGLAVIKSITEEGFEAPPGDTVAEQVEEEIRNRFYQKLHALVSKNNSVPQRDSRGRFTRHANTKG